MGTSVNQASPDTLNWRAVQASYTDDDVEVDRVVQELWRAATNQPDADFAIMLSNPIVARLRAIALKGGTPLVVASEGNRAIAESKQASLVTDIALRAAVQAASTPHPAQSFSERVFAEACNYLVSRDLPGYVGKVERSRTIPDLVQFKQSIIDVTTTAVRKAGVPSRSTAQAWQKHVQHVIAALQKR
jgi:hypothetical protein